MKNNEKAKKRTLPCNNIDAILIYKLPTIAKQHTLPA